MTAFVVRLYFWKLLLSAYLDDPHRLEEGASLLDHTVGFDDVWRGITALKTKLTLSQAAASFEEMVQKFAANDTHKVPLGAVGDWLAGNRTAKGMAIAIDSFAHGAVRNEIASFSDAAHALLGNPASFELLWAGHARSDTRKSTEVVAGLCEMLNGMSDESKENLEDLAGRAFARLKSSPKPGAGPRAGANSQGDLMFDDLEAFVALVAYLHLLTMAFPKIGSTAAAIDYEQFVHLVGCLSLSRPSSELTAVFDGMLSKSKVGATSKVAFDEMVAWYASVRLPTLAAKFWGASADARHIAEMAQALPEFLSEMPNLDKVVRKILLKRFDVAEKMLYETINTTDGASRVFDSIDENGNRILSLDEFHTFLSGKPYSIENDAALVRALKIGTGKEATIADITNADAGSTFSGNAWASRREFAQVLTLAVYFAKIYEMLQLTQAEVSVVQLNISFPTFQKLGKLLGIKVLEKKPKAQAYFDALREDRGSGAEKGKWGWDPASITIEDVVVWHAKETCPNAFSSLQRSLQTQRKASMKPQRKMSKKQKIADAEGKLSNFKQLVSMETRILALAEGSAELDALWKMLDVQPDGTVMLGDFDEVTLQQKFPVLNDPAILQLAFTKTTGREFEIANWFEECEFLPLLINTYYFHRLDHELAHHCTIPGFTEEGTQFNVGRPLLSIGEAKTCLDELGLILSEAALKEELVVADTVQVADFCMWYAGRKCPETSIVNPTASPFTAEELQFEAMLLDPGKVHLFFQSGLAAHYSNDDHADTNTVGGISDDLKKKYPGIHFSADAVQKALTRGALKKGKVIDDGSGNLKTIGDAQLVEADVLMYLLMLLYFNKLYHLYGVNGKQAGLKRLTFTDFQATLRKVGVRVDEAIQGAQFSAMVKQAQAKGETKSVAMFDDVVECLARSRLATVLI
jgi:hypothetical protein